MAPWPQLKIIRRTFPLCLNNNCVETRMESKTKALGNSMRVLMFSLFHWLSAVCDCWNRVWLSGAERFVLNDTVISVFSHCGLYWTATSFNMNRNVTQYKRRWEKIRIVACPILNSSKRWWCNSISRFSFVLKIEFLPANLDRGKTPHILPCRLHFNGHFHLVGISIAYQCENLK